MAKTIATVSGVALAPGVSKNGRLYTREAIAGAVTSAQERLAKGGQPMVMLSHHEAGDDSLRIAAGLRSWSLTEDGRIRWEAAVPDTTAGWEIAALADTSDGKPAFLEGVSIRGHWTGRVRKVKGPDGDPVETADGLELDGLDFTHKPGVPEARIDTFAWTKGGTSETSERVLITESVSEAHLTITEETAPATETAPPGVPEGVREALRAVFGTGPALVDEAATPPMSKRDSGTQGTGGPYADPGYQPDKKQRYQLDTVAHAKAAYAYISQAKNAKLYTPAQLKRIKGRIKAALGKFGVTVASEGWTIDPALQLTEAVAEFYGGDPECAGSYSLTASNGPTTVTVCSYGLDPADLAVILARACNGAGMALIALDPDMDGDIDVPGADAEDTDGDMGSAGMDSGDGVADLAARLAAAFKGESTEDPEALLTEARALISAGTAVPPEPPAPDAGPHTETEVPAMGETTTQEAVAETPAATVPQGAIDAAVAKALADDRAARKARKAAKAQAAESAPAAPVTETDDERIARLVEEKLAAINAPSPPAVAEAEEQRVERLVQEALTREKQALVTQGGGPGRKGLVTEHSTARAAGGEVPEGFPMNDGKLKPMESWNEDERRVAGAALQQYVLGDRAVY